MRFNEAMKQLYGVHLQVFKGAILTSVSAVLISSLLLGGTARAAGPTFVQVVAAQPQTNQSAVTVKFTKAQVAGDTNVLAIGTADTTSNITGVTDSAGNSYAVATPMTRGSSQSQAIYYAKNIAAAVANTNTVTVTFNTPARYVDLRAAEYSGLDASSPLDKSASATGSSSSASTPSVTTTYGNELVFGAGDTSGTFSNSGSGFTKRIITNPDSDIVEDKVVSTVGSYNAVATQSGAWVMQVATFKAAGSTPDTTPPSVPTGLNGNAASQTQVSLSWNASTDNVGVTGYKVYRNGTQVATTTTTSYQDTGLAPGTTYSYSVAAYDAAGNTSAPVTAINVTTLAPDTTPPSAPANLNATPVSTSEIDLSWSASTDNVGVTGYKVYRQGSLVGTSASLSYNDKSLAAGTTYSYTVSAVDAAGNESAQSSAMIATTEAPDTTPPTVPTGLSVGGATTSQLTLNWAGSIDNVGVAGYHVFRGGTQIASTTSTTYQDTGLTANTPYLYTVSAFDAAGNESAQSSAASGTTQQQTGPNFPFVASVSANHRYLLDQFGHPFLMVGDSPHSLTANLTEPQADTYFANRQSHGVNAAWMQALVDGYTGGRSNGATYDGILPFTTPNDFSTPNPAYFQRLSDMVNLAAQHGVTVFLDPMDTAGWQSQYESNGATKDYNYGVYLGTLFKNAPNIVWITGNDYGMWWNATDDNDVTSIAKGIASVDTHHLQTVQLNGTISSSLDDSNWTPIISMNGAYTYYPTYDEVLHAYNQMPTMPVYLQEANYEFENNTNASYPTTNESLRRQSWWTITSGGVAGQMYGNSYTWDTSDWPTEQAHLDTPGVIQMQYWASLLEGHEWYNLTPDQTHTFLTAGMGTYDPAQDDVLQSDYATAAITSDGAFGLVYVPAARTVTVNLSKLSGAVTARWFDPSNNTYQPISGSPFAAGSSSQQFTTPGVNADGNNDWVLVLDGTTGPDTTAPSAPTNLTATGTSGSTASLSWNASTDNVSVAGYKIYRNGTQVGIATTTDYQDSGLSPNTPYSYTVSAYDFAGNESAQSTGATATTTNPDTTPPSTPTGLAATAISSGEIDLSWSAATDSVGVTGYKVYRGGVLVGTTANLNYKDMGLSAGTTYSYTVSAVDAAGNESAQSSTAGATTQSPDTTPPTVPTGLTVTATTSSTVGLSWLPSTDNVGVSSYKVYRNGNLVSAVGTTTFTDTGLTPGSTYTYTVSAYDGSGNESAQSTPATATTGSTTVTTPTFVQLNSTTPQTAQTSVPVAYNQAQTAGNLNIVVIGFYSSTGTISSVTDSAGNVYTLAAPLTRQNATSQAIYYAKNIKSAAAGTNTVTVTFSGSVPYPDIRIAEYAGLDTANPFDVTSSAAGYPTTATSGNVTTTKPVELLFGAGTTAGTFTAAGSGYTLRIITSPDADIVEDQVVASTGTYAATAAQSSDEVMQVVAFKAAGQ